MIDDKTYTSEHNLARAHCAAPEQKYAGLLNVTSRDFSIHISLTDTEETKYICLNVGNQIVYAQHTITILF